MSPRFLLHAVCWCVTGMLASNAQECGRPTILENRIVGGEDATQGAWPWQVDIQNWVLSAAHCFPNPYDVSSYTIYAGRQWMHSYNMFESSHFVSRVVIPSSYSDPESGSDVALVRLSSPVSWSDYVRPVCLPASGTLFPGGLQCHVTGWGNVRNGVPLQGYGTLQQVMVPIISSSTCREMYLTNPSKQVDILSDMICAGYQAGGKDSCQGDSGGPLVCQMANETWVQAGVVSFGEGCAAANHPGVYARLTSFSSFLRDTAPEVRLYGGAHREGGGRAAAWAGCLAALLLLLHR
ncbi:Prostasin [Liparis tanakae]|uniref:Prostasin n=1 Tax=Liparis tanakae TaxID=230148 RepID=A0A4Z2GM17_9TELE|nr:Prostasin [Liparis tanakae]